MKILCGPDLHIRVTPPQHRKDNFVETQKHKIKWILKLAKKMDCKLVFFPGDLTDHARLPYHIVDYYIRLFKSYPEQTILAVRGQHDMLYHVESENTPFSVMDAAGAIKDFGGVNRLFGLVGVSGVDFNGEMPDIVWDLVKGQINILLIHKMFVLDKLWEKQEDFIPSLIFLRKTKWDLIVSGDNHQRYYSFATGDRFHVNCGSLMRQNIDQKDHKPAVYIYDTDERTLKDYEIPIDPIEDVMDLEKAEEEKLQSEELQAFVESIEETTEITGLDFVKNISERLEADDITPGVRELGQEVMRKAGEKV